MSELNISFTPELRRPVLVAEQQRLEALRPDVLLLVQVETRLLHRVEEHLAARQAHVALLEKANDIRTASINTMVARLAFALEDETPCPVCGHAGWTRQQVIWPELARQWELSDDEVAHVDHQQGTTCDGCGTSLRSA